MLIVSQDTGEIVAPAGFHEIFEVDILLGRAFMAVLYF